VTKKDPRLWTKEERMFVMLNRSAYTLECMRICDEEIANRKLKKFVESKEKNATLRLRLGPKSWWN
jgi:hypothetical protein